MIINYNEVIDIIDDIMDYLDNLYDESYNESKKPTVIFTYDIYYDKCRKYQFAKVICILLKVKILSLALKSLSDGENNE